MKNKEPKKGQNWRIGYQTGYNDASKAFGGCKKCYGKGYGTSLQFAESFPDFGDEKVGRTRLPLIVFCDCGRGKQLKRIIEKNKI